MLLSARRGVLGVLVSSLAVVAIGCAQPGRLLVIVESDLGVPAEIDCLRATVAREGERGEDVPFRLRTGADLPLRFAVEPEGGRGLVTIDVGGSRGGCESATNVRARARVNVASGSTRVLRLRLDRACLDELCGDDASRTCDGGACEPTPTFDWDDLPLVTATPHAGRDAGAPLDAPDLDAPALDAAPHDAFVDDAPRLDAPPLDAWIDPFAPCVPLESDIRSPIARPQSYGSVLALSADLCRIVVVDPDEPRDVDLTGRVRVYRQELGAWLFEQALEPTDAFGREFGRSIALSSDASRIAITSYGDATVRIFDRTDDVWMEQLPAVHVVDADVGMRVALSAAGTRLFVANGHETVLVFDRGLDAWEPGTSAVMTANVTALSVSADGLRLAVATIGQRPQVCDAPEWACVPLAVSGASPPSIASLAISGEGDFVAVGIAEGSGRVESFHSLGGAWEPLPTATGGESFGAAIAVDDARRVYIGSPAVDLVSVGSAEIRGPAGSGFGSALDVDPMGRLLVVGRTLGVDVRVVTP
ncbi:MAG: hypothetical protein J0L92_08335 [Deltaproteobacteria bacterium]|nr:hypothetical protein [Deltaproteobacteria bacterium]